MKKRFIVVPLIVSVGALIAIGFGSNKMISVKAEEETSEVVEEELTEEEKETLEEVKTTLSQYFNQTTISLIISALTSTGFLGGLLATIIKYKKYKAMSSKEIAEKVEETVKDMFAAYFKEMSKEQLQGVIDNVDKMMKCQDVLVKAMVLMQDKTSEGRIALLELLNTQAGDNTKEIIDEMIEDTKEEKIKEEEVKDKVAGDYEPIF